MGVILKKKLREFAKNLKATRKSRNVNVLPHKKSKTVSPVTITPNKYTNIHYTTPKVTEREAIPHKDLAMNKRQHPELEKQIGKGDVSKTRKYHPKKFKIVKGKRVYK
jgi:hypothetical protein